MRGSLTISVIAHVVLLALCLIAFTFEPTEAPAVPSVTVDTISIKDFNQMTQGVKDAPKPKETEKPKPLADKIDIPKPVEHVADKVDDKPEIKTETVAKQQPKPDPKPADKPAKPKTPDYKPDQIADILKKDAAKQPPKTDNKPAPPDTSAQNAPKFDANQVSQLLDHRDPRRQVAAADALNSQPSLGAPSGGAAALSEDEKSYIRNHITSCWNPPPGIDATSKVKISLRVLLKQDGTLVTQPVVVEGTPSPLGPALAESAIRAVISCQPFNKLRPEHYDEWRDLTLDFDPPTLFGGG